MARSNEDLIQELLTLRDSDREGWQKVVELRREKAELQTELDWWKRTFGPGSNR